MNFYTHSKDTPAGELHGSCEVFLHVALKELRGLDVEVILPADKGNATVM